MLKILPLSYSDKMEKAVVQTNNNLQVNQTWFVCFEYIMGFSSVSRIKNNSPTWHTKIWTWPLCDQMKKRVSKLIALCNCILNRFDCLEHIMTFSSTTRIEENTFPRHVMLWLSTWLPNKYVQLNYSQGSGTRKPIEVPGISGKNQKISNEFI